MSFPKKAVRIRIAWRFSASMITSYQITCSKVSAELFQKRTNNNTTTPNNNTTNNITNKKEEITKRNIIREEIRTNKTEEEIIRDK